MAKIKVGRGELKINIEQAKSILPDTRVEVRPLSQMSAPIVLTVKEILPLDGWPNSFVLVDEKGFEHTILGEGEIKIL